MRRRDVTARMAALLLAAVAILTSVAEVRPQVPSKQARVAVLSPFSPPDPGIAAFLDELARLGWVEGRNLELNVGWVHGRLEHLPRMAEELLSGNPDVIFTPGEQGLAAAKKPGTTTPIVTVACDPLDRLIVSLAAPGGSATGLSCIHSELAGERLATLKELMPTLARAAVLYIPSDPNKQLEFEQLRTAGDRLGGFHVEDISPSKVKVTVGSQEKKALAHEFGTSHRSSSLRLAPRGPEFPSKARPDRSRPSVRFPGERLCVCGIRECVQRDCRVSELKR